MTSIHNTNTGNGNIAGLSAKGSITIIQGSQLFQPPPNPSEQGKGEEREKKMAKRILILSANSYRQKQLRLDTDIRNIDERLKLAIERRQITLKVQLATRFSDFQTQLLEYNPHIVHFMGHGEEEGILLADSFGFAEPVPTGILARLFQQMAQQVECVILGACFSSKPAEAVSQHIPYVIGVKREIMDRAAIEFSVGFYTALGTGRSVEDAYQVGCICMNQACPDIPEHDNPILYKRRDACFS